MCPFIGTKKRKVLCKKDLKTSYQQNFGPFAVKDYLKGKKALEEEVRVIFDRKIKLKKSEQDEENFKTSERFCICEQLSLLENQNTLSYDIKNIQLNKVNNVPQPLGI